MEDVGKPAGSLPGAVRSMARLYGPKNAFSTTRADADWMDVWSSARSLALRLFDEGVDKRDLVALAAADELDELVASIGIMAAGCVVAPVRPGSRKPLGARLLVSVSQEGGEDDASGPCVHMPPVEHVDGRSLDRFNDDPRIDEALSWSGPEIPALALEEDDGSERVIRHVDIIGPAWEAAGTAHAGLQDRWLHLGPQNNVSRLATAAAAIVSGGEAVFPGMGHDPLTHLWRHAPTVLRCTRAQLKDLASSFDRELANMRGMKGMAARWTMRRLDAGRNKGPVYSLARELGLPVLASVLGGRLAAVFVEEDAPEGTPRNEATGSAGLAALGCSIHHWPSARVEPAFESGEGSS